MSRDDLEAHRRFAEKTGAKFPLLSDEKGEVAKRYGGQLPILPITARKLFLIDKRGILRAIVDGMPDNATLLAEIDRLNAEG